MSERSIRLEIVTPVGMKLKEEASMVVAPGVEGDLGILPGHIPLVTRLRAGAVRVYKGDRQRVLAVSEGYMEVSRDRVIILAEAADKLEDIDVEETLIEMRAAEEELAAHRDDESIIRAQAALQRATNRLKVAEKARDSNVHEGQG